MPELIHKIKKDGHELKRSVPSRLRWQPVDTSMFTAMGMERDDLGTVELFRAGGFARTILASRNVLYLIERIGTTKALRSWAMPVQALLTAEPAPSQSDEGSRPVVADDPHDEARAEIASEPIVEARDVFRDDLAEPAPMPEPAVADEPADVVPIFAPAVAPALGREVVSSPAADGLPTPTVVPTPSPVVSRALSREVVFSVATTASFLFGGTLGLLVGRARPVRRPRRRRSLDPTWGSTKGAIQSTGRPRPPPTLARTSPRPRGTSRRSGRPSTPKKPSSRNWKTAPSSGSPNSMTPSSRSRKPSLRSRRSRRDSKSGSTWPRNSWISSTQTRNPPRTGRTPRPAGTPGPAPDHRPERGIRCHRDDRPGPRPQTQT